MFLEQIKSIEEHGKSAKGRTELIKHLGGGKLTRSQAMKAMCYDCMGYFSDGREDCGAKNCPMYDYRTYKDA